MLTFTFVPQYTEEHFDFFKCVSWPHLTHLALMEVVLIGKCIKTQLSTALIKRNRIIYIEVRSKNDKVPRYVSKENLNTVMETFIKK